MAPGMWASSNCSLVRASTRTAPSAMATSTARGVSGAGAADLLEQRAAVERDDVLDVGRRGAERVERGGDEGVTVGVLQRGVVLALEGDRRRALVVHRRAAAGRAAEVAGPDLDLAGKVEQALPQRRVDVVGACLGVDGEVGPGDVADEQRVSREHRPRRVAALGRRAPGRTCARAGGRACAPPRVRRRRARAASRPRRPRAGTPRRRASGCGSSRPSPAPAGRGRRRGRRDCASRARARCARRAGGSGAGRARCPTAGPRPPRRRVPCHR